MASQDFGNPAYNSVASLYNTVTGGKYTPTQADVSQWGSNLDPNYLNTIQNQIGTWWSNDSANPAVTPSFAAVPGKGNPVPAGSPPFSSNAPTPSQYLAPVTAASNQPDFTPAPTYANASAASPPPVNLSASTPGQPVGNPTGTVAAPNTSNSAFLDAYQAAMLSQLQQLQTPTGLDDPNIAPAIAANKVTGQRGLAQTNDAMAEQLAAEGLLHSGAADVSKQTAAEQEASNEANFAGTAVTNQNSLRQAALSNLLGLGSAQQINASNLGLGQQQLAQQNAQFGDQLTTQNNQFGDQLGFNYANLSNTMNYQAMMALLTGGSGAGL